MGLSFGDAALTAAVVGVPGAGLSLTTFPAGTLRAPARIASVPALGYAACALTALLLAAAGLLDGPAFAVALLLVTAAAWHVPGRRLLASRPRLRRPEATTAAALAALAIFAVARTDVSAGVNLASGSGFRYWADGLEIAAAHGIPSATYEWGRLLPVTVSKVGLNAFEAALTPIVGQAPLPAMGVLTWLAAIALFASLWALADELGLRLLAPLLPLLTVALPVGWRLGHGMSADSTLYRAENVGRMVAFAALALGIHALRAPGARRAYAAAGVALGVAAATHLIPALVAAFMLACFGLASPLAGRPLRPALLAGFAIAGFAAGTYGGMLLVAGGDIGFGGASGGGYGGFHGGMDPTAYFHSGRLVPLAGHGAPLRSALHTAFRGYMTVSADVQTARVGLLVVVAAAALALAVALLRRPLAPLAAVALGLLVLVPLVAALFANHYGVLTPETFGERRLFDYGALPFVLVLLAAGEVALGFLAPRSAALAVAAAAVACVGLAFVTSRSLPYRPGAKAAAAHVGDAQAALGLVSRNVPCGAVMLANARTAATFEAATGRHSLTEGMAPYLRPPILRAVDELLLDVRGFFEHPASGRAFLERHRVGYLLVVGRVPLAQEKGAEPLHPDLGGIPWLEPRGSVPGARLFAVRGVAAPAGGPQPARCPARPPAFAG